jgi:hypothetical protein
MKYKIKLHSDIISLPFAILLIIIGAILTMIIENL